MGNRMIRSYALTQKGMTATCKMCGGVGAMLASGVSAARRAGIGRGTEILIPCPGCFATPTQEGEI